MNDMKKVSLMKSEIEIREELERAKTEFYKNMDREWQGYIDALEWVLELYDGFDAEVTELHYGPEE